MNILLFTSSSNKSGGTRQALYLAQGLTERGHSVTMFIPRTSTLPSIAPDWPHFTYLDAPNTWRKTIEAAMPTQGKGCIVHAFHNAAVKKAAWWGLFWKKKAVVVAHRGVIFRPNNPLPYWSPGIDSFFVNSEKCASILHSIGVSRQRLVVVPNSIPDDRVTPTLSTEDVKKALDIPEDTLLFGTVAADSPIKGVEPLLRAFALLKAHGGTRHVKLLIVGATPEKWFPLCQTLQIENDTLLVSPTESVANYLNAMSVFVLPSLSESMPNTLLEAVRIGKPAIGTDVGAVSEIINTCGICIQPGKPDILAEAMLRMVNEPGVRDHFASQALQEGVKYTPSVRLNLVEQLYSTLMQQRGFTL